MIKTASGTCFSSLFKEKEKAVLIRETLGKAIYQDKFVKISKNILIEVKK